MDRSLGIEERLNNDGKNDDEAANEDRNGPANVLYPQNRDGGVYLIHEI